MDDWQFGENLAALRGPLLRGAGIRAIDLYADLLDDATAKEVEGRSLSIYWSVWRPWIGSDREHPGRAEVLLSAIRDDADEFAARGSEQLAEAAGFLLRRGGVLKRVAHYILAERGQAVPAIVRQEIVNEENWKSRFMPREFSALVRRHLPLVSNSDVDVIVKWLEGGPDRRDDDDPRFVPHWRHRRLSLLTGRLSDELEAELVRLVVEFGPLEDPGTDTPVTARFVGPTSPFDADQLAAEGAEEVIDRLLTWKPSGGWGQPTPEGLGRELSKMIVETPSLIQPILDAAPRLHPTYIRATLQAVRDAARDKREVPWPAALELARFATDADGEVEHLTSDPFDADQDWSGARRAAAWVALTALETDSVGPAEAVVVWDVLAELLTDPEPDTAYEAEYGSQNMDWPSLAINTTRPLAVLATIAYAVRMEQLEVPSESAKALGALAEFLNGHGHASLSVQSVFGQSYPRLRESFPAWAAQYRDRIFPPADDASVVWWAAWEAFLAFNGPSRLLISDLNESYLLALGRTEPPDWRHMVEPAQRLAEHLVIAYGQEWLPLEGGLLTSTAISTRRDVWTAMVGFAGRILQSEQLSPEWVERLQRLWDERRNAYESGRSTPAEIAEFGWWVLSHQVPTDWILSNLEWVLRRTPPTRGSGWGMMDRMAGLASEHALSVLTCVALLVDTPSEGWQIQAWRAQLKAILEKTRGQDPAVEAKREEIASRLVIKWGLLEFRDFDAAGDGPPSQGPA